VLATPQCPEWSTGFHAPGVDGEIYSLLRHDDGSGEVVYIGGRFTSAGGVPARNVARWDGSTWSAVGDGPSGVAFALAVYDDGTGPALYAGGQPYFTNTPEFLERYDGSSWSSIPVTGGISALEVHDDGTGEALYVGGYFTSIGGLSTIGIAQSDGFPLLAKRISRVDAGALLPFSSSSSPSRRSLPSCPPYARPTSI